MEITFFVAVKNFPFIVCKKYSVTLHVKYGLTKDNETFAPHPL